MGSYTVANFRYLVRCLIATAAILLIHSPSAVTAQCSTESDKNKNNSNYDVVIIGAGMAGSRAAQTFRLYNKNRPDDQIKFVVFEATKRAGGRIGSFKFGISKNNPKKFYSGFDTDGNNVGCHCDDPPCRIFKAEFGAGWMTGLEETEYGQNRLLQRTTLLNDGRKPLNYTKIENTWEGYYLPGPTGNLERIPVQKQNRMESALREGLEKCVDPRGSRLYNHWCENKPNKPLPVTRQALEGGFTRAFSPQQNCKEWTNVARNDPQLANFVQNFWIYSESTTRNVSLFAFPEFFPFENDIAYVTDQRGFDKMVKSLLPKKNAKFQHKVTNVNYSSNNQCCPEYPVQVTVTNRKKNTDEIVCTKKVLSTMSYGVVQDQPNLFTPQIDTSATVSPWREHGKLVKMYFRFPKKFWGDDSTYLTFAMTEEFRNQNGVKCDYFYNLDKVYEKNSDLDGLKALFCFLSSPDLENMNIDTATKEEFAASVSTLLEPLRVAYGDDYVEPNCWRMVNWDNEYFRGAYPVAASDRSLFVYDNFYKPRKIDNRAGGPERDAVYLSGDHSCYNIWGFAEAAYEAGDRDAKRILRDVKGTRFDGYSICGLGGDRANWC